jgi:hypothetical protein
MVAAAVSRPFRSNPERIIIMSLKSLILARTLTGGALADLFAGEFASDAMCFVTSSSDQEIMAAIAALPTTKGRNPRITGEMYKGLGHAISMAMDTLRKHLPDGRGWDGGKMGSFKRADREKRLPYLAAHAAAVEAFKATLAGVKGWVDTPAKTDEEKKAEKAKREADKEEKRLEEKARIRAELVAEGDLIPRDSVTLVTDLTVHELIGAVHTIADERDFSDSEFQALQALIASVALKREIAAARELARMNRAANADRVVDVEAREVQSSKVLALT